MKTSIMLYQPEALTPCSYLSGKLSSSQYIDPETEPDIRLSSQLNRLGFRRSGRLVYRPSCPDCSACTSVRIPVGQFVFKRRYRRVLNNLKHWRLSVQRPSAELYPLYERYIQVRHADGGMYPPSYSQFDDFLVSDFGNTFFLVAEEAGNVVACLVFDRMTDGLSSVYCFFDPDKSELSPGTFMILQINKLCLSLGLPHHYLGYWVSGSKKMDYKIKYQPLEQFKENQWSSFQMPDKF